MNHALAKLGFCVIFSLASATLANAGWLDHPHGCSDNCLTPVIGARSLPGYRATSARVPVTYYRPATSFDPARGQTVTTLQPCEASEWHPRTVASWLPGSRAPADCFAASASVCDVVSTEPCGQWSGPSAESVNQPYYQPAATPSLVPVPAIVPRPTLSPAETRPQLESNPLPPQRLRPITHQTMTSVELNLPQPDARQAPTTSIQLVPPMLSSRDNETSGSDLTQVESVAEPEVLPEPLEVIGVPEEVAVVTREDDADTLVPISWQGTSITNSQTAEPFVPVVEIWDDSGWQAEPSW